MDDRWSASVADRLAQEGRFLGVAFNKVDQGAGGFRQRTSNHQAWKSRARAQIDPIAGQRRDIQKLQ